MSRSLKKGPFIDFKLAKKVAALGADDRTVIKTWARSSTITPEMVDCIFLFIFQRIWLDINLVNLRQHVNSENTVERIRNNG